MIDTNDRERNRRLWSCIRELHTPYPPLRVRNREHSSSLIDLDNICLPKRVCWHVLAQKVTFGHTMHGQRLDIQTLCSVRGVSRGAFE